jgi:hypothetical protein
MAATDSLTRIGGLVERLTSLDQKQRGMPIEADDWNTVVDVLRGILELDRGQEESVGARLEESFARADHEHLGEVTRAWLDADLQAGSGSGSSSVATHRALADMKEQVASLGASVATLLERIDELQRQVDRYGVNDLDRKRFVTGFEDRFASVEALGTTVSKVSGEFDGLRGNLDEVLELRAALTDGQGNPIDVSNLRSDVADLQNITANLDGIDGSPVRLRDVELRLQEISDVVGLGTEGLEGRLAVLSTDLEARLETRSDERASTLEASLASAQEERVVALKSELDTSLSEASSQLAAESEAQVTAAESRLQASLETRVKEEGETIRSEQTELAQALVGQQGDELRVEISTAVTASRAEVEEALTSGAIEPLRAELGGSLEALGARLDEDIAAASARIDSSVADLESSFGDDLSGAIVELRAETDASLEAGLAGFEAKVTAQVESDVATSLAGLRQEMDAGFAEVRTDLTADLTRSFQVELGTIRKEIDSGLADVEVQLTRDFRAELSTATERIDKDIASLKKSPTRNPVIFNPNRPTG